jgi:hypothetical protein
MAPVGMSQVGIRGSSQDKSWLQRGDASPDFVYCCSIARIVLRACSCRSAVMLEAEIRSSRS